MSLPSPEVQSRIAELRMKAALPGGLTTEEMREAIGLLRADRMSASQTSDKARGKRAAAKAPVDAAALLGELEAL